jgi:hypothetical protein
MWPFVWNEYGGGFCEDELWYFIGEMGGEGGPAKTPGVNGTNEGRFPFESLENEAEAVDGSE